MKAPILFIIFNRLDTTKKVFEAIRKYSPSRLYIAADGPRDKGAEKKVCENIRSWVLDSIDWDCELKTLFQDDNLGCGVAPSTAISWFFREEEEGIILEDDCLPHPDFFTFCEQLLDIYREDKRVSIISGCNFDLLNKYKTKESYFYSVFPYTWGWASWRRNWEEYEYNLESWKDENQSKFLSYLFLEKKYKQSWKKFFDNLSNNLPKDIWDLQFFYQCFKRKQLSIVPNVNLISNIGAGELATHTMSEENPKMNIQLEALSLPIIHPLEFTRNKDYDMFLQELNFGVVEQVPLFKRLKRLIKKIKRK